MTLTGWLPLIVALLGLAIYFVCAGVSKGTAGEVGRIAYAVGLLAFLIGAGSVIESCSTSGGTTFHEHR